MGKRPFLLGLDVGTLSTKGVLVNCGGAVLLRASASHAVRHPRPGWMEHDAEADWWGDSVQVIRELLEHSGLAAEQIAGVGVSGLFPVLCPADGAGRPLRNAILYSDPRAAAEVRHVAEASGVKLKGDEAIPKFLWLQQHEAEVAAGTRMLFSVPGYVVYQLSGTFCMDFQTAYRLGGVIDAARRGWQADLCAELGIPVDILPPIRSPLEVVGNVTAAAARHTGLREGTPVLAGATDTLATLVGNGVTAQGEAMIYYGSSGFLTVCRADLDRVLAEPRLVDDETPFILAAYLLNLGEALDWFVKSILFQDSGPAAYETLEAGAAELPPGSGGLLAMPHFGGRVLPQVMPYARGGFFGLTTRHNRFHLWRALLEAFGYAIRQSVLALEATGIVIGRTTATGGGARSELWRQIVSDVTGLAQEYVADGDAALGAAFLAGLGLGVVDGFSAMRERWLACRRRTEPQPGHQQRYSRLFGVYQALDECLGEHYRALAEAAEG